MTVISVSICDVRIFTENTLKQKTALKGLFFVIWTQNKNLG